MADDVDSTPGAAGDDAASALGSLLRLQDLDTAISQLQHRRASLPERQQLAEVTEALGGVVRRVAEVAAARDDLLRRQDALEVQRAQASSRQKAIEQHMYAARGAASRDLQAMDEEIRQLQHRAEEMEDAEIELMIALEPLDVELATLTDERRRLEAEASTLGDSLASAEGEIERELGQQGTARVAAAAAVPAELRQRYDALRARLGGTGAARLVGNRCGGCHLELPAMEVDRIHRLPPGAVVTCEQCGRILVPQSGTGDTP
jgi:predicted  nucleic acid-binding Zn-ribbon protein